MRYEVGQVYWTGKGRAVVMARIGLQSGQHQLIVCHIDSSGHCTQRLHHADGVVCVTDPATQRILTGFNLEPSRVGKAEVAPAETTQFVGPHPEGRTVHIPNSGGTANNTSGLTTDPPPSPSPIDAAWNRAHHAIHQNDGKRDNEGAEVSQIGSPLAIIGRLEMVYEVCRMRAEVNYADTIKEAIDTIVRLDQSLCDLTSRITDGGKDGHVAGIPNESDLQPF